MVLSICRVMARQAARISAGAAIGWSWAVAIARLRAGALDAAIAALEPVLALPPGERTAVEGQRLSVVRAELAHPVYRGSPAARGLDEQLAGFAPGELGSLPGQ